MTPAMALLLAAFPATQGAKPDPQYIQLGSYVAGSKLNDPEALGGFGSSDLYPSRIADAKLLGKSLKATLSATKKGLVLVLANGGKTTAWVHAGDSNILAYLEAKDARGQWRPIEYKPWYTCGNSYHRLGLPASHGWRFEVPIPKGSLKTKVRWRYYGRAQENDLLSNEVDLSIPPTKFELEPILTATCEISTEWGPPTLMPKPQHVPPPVR